VLVDLGPQPHLLDLDGGRALSRHLQLLALLVAELPVIHDPAHGWIGIRGDLDEIHSHLARFRQGLGDRQNPQLLALEVDDAHLGDPDSLVDPKMFFYRTPPARWHSASPQRGRVFATRSGCTSRGRVR